MKSTHQFDSTVFESWVKSLAKLLRGSVEPSRMKDILLAIVFLKRLNDLATVTDPVDDVEGSRRQRQSRFAPIKLPETASWSRVTETMPGIGRRLFRALTDLSFIRRLDGIFNASLFKASHNGQQRISDELLHSLCHSLIDPRYDLGIAVSDDAFGQLYETLLARFVDSRGMGEFFTPPSVCGLVAQLTGPRIGDTVLDPSVGSGGLLLALHEHVHARAAASTGRIQPSRLRCYGQDVSQTAASMSCMTAFVHGMSMRVRVGNALVEPAFRTGTRLKRFDLIVANPPWNQTPPAHFTCRWASELGHAASLKGSMDWMWVRLTVESLQPHGRAAIILDSGALSRGLSTRAQTSESKVRLALIQADLIEAVYALPANLFYNTRSPCVLIILNRRKVHPGKILLVDATRLYRRGRRKNFLSEAEQTTLGNLYRQWNSVQGLSRVMTVDDIYRHGGDLRPQRYVHAIKRVDKLSSETVLKEVNRLLRLCTASQTAIQRRARHLAHAQLECKERVILPLSELVTVHLGRKRPADVGKVPVYGSAGQFAFTTEPLVIEPTILVGRKGNAGAIHVPMQPCWPADTVYYLRSKTSKVLLLYIAQVLRDNPHSVEQTTVRSLSRETLLKTPIPVPVMRVQRAVIRLRAAEEGYGTLQHNLGTRLKCLRQISTQ